MKLVSALAIAAAMSFAQNTPAAAQDGIPGPEQDSYIWLEEARSDKALDWVRAENERTMEMLAGDPRYDAVKAEALAIYDSEDRIPYVTIRPDGGERRGPTAFRETVNSAISRKTLLPVRNSVTLRHRLTLRITDVARNKSANREPAPAC